MATKRIAKAATETTPASVITSTLNGFVSGEPKSKISIPPIPTVSVFLNFNKNVYLRFFCGPQFDYFLRMHAGIVEVARFRKALVSQLTQSHDSPIHAAEVMTRSMFERTDAARHVLALLVRSSSSFDLDVCFTECVEGEVESGVLTKAEKMKVIGDGAARIVRQNGVTKTFDKNEADVGPISKRAKKERAATPAFGGRSLKEICKSLDLEPGEARKLMRAAKWAKPASGRWEWSDADAVTVEADLKKLMGSGVKPGSEAL